MGAHYEFVCDLVMKLTAEGFLAFLLVDASSPSFFRFVLESLTIDALLDLLSIVDLVDESVNDLA